MKNMILFLAIIFISLSFNACKVDTQVEQQSQQEEDKKLPHSYLLSTIEVNFNSYRYDNIPDLYIQLTNEYPDYEGIAKATEMYNYATNKSLIEKDRSIRKQNEEKLIKHYFNYTIYDNYREQVKQNIGVIL